MDKPSDRKLSDDEIDAILFGGSRDKDLEGTEEHGMGTPNQENVSVNETKNRNFIEDSAAANHIADKHGDMPMPTDFVAWYFFIRALVLMWQQKTLLDFYFDPEASNISFPILFLLLPALSGSLHVVILLGMVGCKKWSWWLAVVQIALRCVEKVIPYSLVYAVVGNQFRFGFYEMSQAVAMLSGQVVAEWIFTLLPFLMLVFLFSDQTLGYFGFRKFAKPKEE